MEEIKKEIKTFNYWCSINTKDCLLCDKKGMCQIDVEVEIVNNNNKMPIDEFVCPSCFNIHPLKLMGQAVPKMRVTKMTSKDIKIDRMKRSDNHFKNEVFDYLPKEDKKMLVKNKSDLSKRLK